jgi:hypothetical protein
MQTVPHANDEVDIGWNSVVEKIELHNDLAASTNGSRKSSWGSSGSGGFGKMMGFGNKDSSSGIGRKKTSRDLERSIFKKQDITA